MNPQISAFALGLLLGAAKVGFIGTIGFGIAWWRTRLKLRRVESELQELEEQVEARRLPAPDPAERPDTPTPR